MKVGIIGCGNISDTYFNCQKIFNNFNIISCADVDEKAAIRSAKKHNIEALKVDDLLNNSNIELILNLTIPSAHKEIIYNSIKFDKHCFSEKPLAINFQEGLELKKISDEKKLFIGCAPDTFLGAACQKAREIIDTNKIGKISLGTFNMMSHGMEHWHPNPDFFFKTGGGPIFDLGVYYITQLVNLLGPVKNIKSISSTVEKKRTIKSDPRKGDIIQVETPTTLMGILNFHNSSKIQFFSSWDVWKHKHSHIELYGSEGSIILPDPNFFGGNLFISKKENEWEIVNTKSKFLGVPNYNDNGVMRANYRGVGLSEMIQSILNNSKPRCSIDISLHVLEVMEGILTSSKKSKIYEMSTTCQKPESFNEDEISIILKK